MTNSWRIRFNAPFIVGKELEYINHTVTEGRLAGDGQYTKDCHKWLESNLNCSAALLTHSGTSALEMAALLCEISVGDEVIMPSFTFVSTANAFVLRGAIPVFVDICPKTLNLDVNAIEAAISNKTKAIVPVHYGGLPCDMDEIKAIAHQYNLRIIEDAAHAMLSSYKGQKLGSIGDLGCLSFHETKNIISGEGGALLINDPELVARARVLWEKGTNRHAFIQGQVDKYTWVDIGSSFLPSELTAAFLFAQLQQARKIIDKRLDICNQYRKGLAVLEIDGLANLSASNKHGDENGHIFYILTDNLLQRNDLIKYLASHSIMAVFHYVPLHSSPAGLRYGKQSGDLSVTNDISDRLVRLPLHFRLSIGDVSEVINRVREFYGVAIDA